MELFFLIILFDMQQVDNKSISERLRKIESDLRLKSRRAFALSINADPSFFDKILKGTTPLTEAYAEALEKKYGVSREWLFSGEGEVYLKDRPHSFDEWMKTVNSNLEKLLSGQDDILDQQAYTRAEIRGVSRYLIFQDAKDDVKKMEGLLELYRKLVGGALEANEKMDTETRMGR